jgi:hypothetical protein
MRIHIKKTLNSESVSFNCQPKLVGIQYKWLDTNELHGKPVVYFFSWSLNAKVGENGRNCPMKISGYRGDLLKKCYFCVKK